MTKAAVQYTKVSLTYPPTFRSGWAANSLPGADQSLSQALRERCNSFSPKIDLYTVKGGDDTKYILKTYRFNIAGGRPDAVLARYKEVVALLEEQEVKDLFAEGGWGGGTTLRATSYVPANNEEIAKWEAEKLRAEKLIQSVKSGREKYQQAQKKRIEEAAARERRRAEADKVAAKVRAEQDAKDKKAAEERAKASTIGGAMEILRAAGYTVISNPVPEKKSNPVPEKKSTTKKK